MALVKAEYSFDGSRLTFYFTSEKRVDFRVLVRDLARTFQTRIELRQVGPRDEAKLLGGIGPCGRLLCCSTFLPDYARVSIKMAKDQDLPLNPTKISGVCGRLLCCLSYEHEQYLEIKAELPQRGAWVQTPDGPGEVVTVNVVRENGDRRAGRRQHDRLHRQADRRGAPSASPPRRSRATPRASRPRSVSARARGRCGRRGRPAGRRCRPARARRGRRSGARKLRAARRRRIRPTQRSARRSGSGARRSGLRARPGDQPVRRSGPEQPGEVDAAVAARAPQGVSAGPLPQQPPGAARRSRARRSSA